MLELWFFFKKKFDKNPKFVCLIYIAAHCTFMPLSDLTKLKQTILSSPKVVIQMLKTLRLHSTVQIYTVSDPPFHIYMTHKKAKLENHVAKITNLLLVINEQAKLINLHK
uniref:Uncharacterized protein n=1 Tax=Micrurus paraensis TaxID=1970185 RepID=A0A2D4KCJ9_9SAUR